VPLAKAILNDIDHCTYKIAEKKIGHFRRPFVGHRFPRFDDVGS